MLLKRACLLLSLCLAAIFLSLSAAYAVNDFVRVSGDELVCNGHVYKIKGTNYYPRDHMWASMWSSWDWPRIQQDAALIDSIGLNAVRILVPYSNGNWGGANVNMTNLQHLEDLVNLLGEKGIRSCITLFDWETSFPYTYESKWYSHLQYMRTIVNRLKDNKYVLMWDVKNEPDHPDNIGWHCPDNWDYSSNKNRIVTWLRNMCNEVRIANGGNQLVTCGLRWYENIDDAADFVDVAICHSYWHPTPPSWPSPQSQIEHMRQFTNKPILMQEFGYPSGGVRNPGEVFTEPEQQGSYEGHIAAWLAYDTSGGIQWMTFDASKDGDNIEEHFGLWRYDYSLKPAGQSFRDLYPAFQFPTSELVPPQQVANFTASPGWESVKLEWTNPYSDFRGVVIRYSTSGYPSTPTSGTLLKDFYGLTAGQTETFIHDNLQPGTTYYYSAFAYDPSDNFSSGVSDSATPPVPQPCTCAQARNLDSGDGAYITNALVTAVFAEDDCIYIQDANRCAGIRVALSNATVQVGDTVNVLGMLADRMSNGINCERVITNATVTKVASNGTPKPINMNCRNVGGVSNGHGVLGVDDGVGPNNIGLLVNVVGRVASIDGTIITVQDGSRGTTSNELLDVKVRCPSAPEVAVGDLVSVTGIVEGDVPEGWEVNRRCLHARSVADICLINMSPSVSGVITDVWGEPVANAVIVGSPGDTITTSDSNGQYLIGGFEVGYCDLTISAEGFVTQTISGIETRSGERTIQDITLASTMGRINGTVYAQDGSPMNNASVYLTIDGKTRSLFTGSDGAYSFYRVPAGTQSIKFQKAGYMPVTKSVTVVADQAMTVNATMVPAGGRVSGIITDYAGNAVSGAVVTITPGDFTGITNSSGSYAVDGIPTGTYTVSVSKPGYMTATKTNVSVTSGSITVVSLSLGGGYEKLTNGTFSSSYVPFWGGSIGTGWGACWVGSYVDASWSSLDLGGTHGHVQVVRGKSDGFEVGIGQEVSGLTPGATYTLKLEVFPTSSNYTIWMAVVPGLTGSSIPADCGTQVAAVANQWVSQEISGTVDSTGSVTCYAWVERQDGSSYDIYFDNLSLKSW